MKDNNHETLQENFENKVKCKEINPYYHKIVKKNYSNRVESWYLEKSKDGKFGMEYFSTVKERLHFFKECKGFKTDLESIDKMINNFSIK